METLACWLESPQHFLFSQTFTHVLKNDKTKRENNLNCLLHNVNSLCFKFYVSTELLGNAVFNHLSVCIFALNYFLNMYSNKLGDQCFINSLNVSV